MPIQPQSILPFLFFYCRSFLFFKTISSEAFLGDGKMWAIFLASEDNMTPGLLGLTELEAGHRNVCGLSR